MKLLLQGIRLTCSIWLPRPWVFVFWYSQSVKKTDFEFRVWLCMVRQVPARHLSPQSSSLLIQGFILIFNIVKTASVWMVLCRYEYSCQRGNMGCCFDFFFFFNESNHHLSDPNQRHSRSPWAFYLDSNKRQHCPSQEQLHENILLLFILGKKVAWCLDRREKQIHVSTWSLL